ncbi:ANTAR domain-containing response regulator [Desulfotomaculum sp. 1211_IL3151]|uniref:ANTAR domain-containing response regulator n=1 Tax=Desulfotomaculum sp. 1211_IL3151 TaxID=3084055 RepID=UPI002FD99620
MKSLRIVLADDEFLTRMDLKEMLTELGHQVVGEAPNGLLALDLVRKLKPDLAILDVKMPKLDGIKAAKLITGEKLGMVILLTAFSEDELITSALDAGVMGYLTKPVTEKELAPALQIAWERYREIMLLKHKKVQLKERLNKDIRQEKLKNTSGKLSK